MTRRRLKYRYLVSFSQNGTAWVRRILDVADNLDGTRSYRCKDTRPGNLSVETRLRLIETARRLLA